jgi:hypothetical protein
MKPKDTFVRNIGAFLTRIHRKVTRSTVIFKRSSWFWLLTVLVIFLNATVDLIEKGEDITRWFGLDRCYQYNPATGRQDSSLPARACLPGKITYIKYLYPYAYPGAPADRPNRVLQVISVQNGQIAWTEQAFLGMQGKKEKWDKGKSFWMELEGGQDVPTFGALDQPDNPEIGVTIPASGFVMRRLDILQRECRELKPPQTRTTPVSVFEYFVENPLDRNATGFSRFIEGLFRGGLQDLSGKHVYVYSRWTSFFCDQDLSTFFKFGPSFGATGYEVTQQAVDR